MVELIITLFIGSLLLAWGVTNYRDFKVRKQVSDSANELVYGFNLARAEAIRYGSNVRVVKTGANWNQGWSIYTVDENGSVDEQIYVQEPLDGSLKLTQSGAYTGVIEFNNLGALTSGVGTQFNVENDPYVHGSAPVANSARNIQISPSGSAKVVKP